MANPKWGSIKEESNLGTNLPKMATKVWTSSYGLDHWQLPFHLENIFQEDSRYVFFQLIFLGLTDEHLYKLMQLKNLTKLHLGNKYGINVPSQQNNDSIFGFSFYEGVAPVLNEIGVNLRKLVLEEHWVIDY